MLPVEWLARRAARSKIALSVVFSDLHALIGTLRTHVVRELADWLSSPPGNERRFDGSAGADDDSARRWGGTWRASTVTRRNTDSAGTTSSGPCWPGRSLQHASWRWLFLVNIPVGLLGIVLAISLSFPKTVPKPGRKISTSSASAQFPQGSCSLLYGVDHVGERIGLTAFFAALVLLTVFIRTATRKGDDALIDLQLFRGKIFQHRC